MLVFQKRCDNYFLLEFSDFWGDIQIPHEKLSIEILVRDWLYAPWSTKNFRQYDLLSSGVYDFVDVSGFFLHDIETLFECQLNRHWTRYKVIAFLFFWWVFMMEYSVSFIKISVYLLPDFLSKTYFSLYFLEYTYTGQKSFWV